MRYTEWILARGGGLITTGEHLGIFVAPLELSTRCPAGWIFIDVTQATVEIIDNAIAAARNGRKAWPERDGDAR